MAGNGNDDSRKATAIRRASSLVSEALDLLDAHGGPAEATAHLDLAIQELRDHLVPLRR